MVSRGSCDAEWITYGVVAVVGPLICKGRVLLAYDPEIDLNRRLVGQSFVEMGIGQANLDVADWRIAVNWLRGYIRSGWIRLRVSLGPQVVKIRFCEEV